MNCSTWIIGVPVHVDIRCFTFFHVYFSHGLLVYLPFISGGYQVKFEPYFFSRVIHVAFFMWIIDVHFQVYWVNCFTWINSVPVHVDNIRWISCEECHLISLHLFSMCIFHIDYPLVYLSAFLYLINIMWLLSLDFLLMYIPRGFFTWIIGVGLHIHAYYTWLHNSTPVRYGPLCAARGPSDNIMLPCWSDPPHRPTYLVCHFFLVVYTLINIVSICLKIWRRVVMATAFDREVGGRIRFESRQGLVFFICQTKLYRKQKKTD